MPIKKRARLDTARIRTTIETKRWQVTANRYVAFLDIMGFKDMVARSTHEEIYTMMKRVDEVKKTAENVKWGYGKEIMVKSTFFSDSIVLYTKDDTYDSLLTIFAIISSITNDLLTSSIPHKGALAFGKMTIDSSNSIFFGQPLIDAYLLQEELNLYCIVLHSTVEREMENQKIILPKLFFNYLCPFKGGSSSHLMIPPIYTSSPKVSDEKEVQALREGVKKLRHRTSGHIRKYIDNTEVYLDRMKILIEESR